LSRNCHKKLDQSQRSTATDWDVFLFAKLKKDLVDIWERAKEMGAAHGAEATGKG